MQLNSFRVNKFHTINTVRSELLKSDKKEQKLHRTCYQSPSLVSHVKSKIQYILQQSSLNLNPKRYHSQDQYQLTNSPNSKTMEAINTNDSGPQNNHIKKRIKIQEQILDSKQQRMKLKMQLQLKKRRQKFLNQYGYVKRRAQNSIQRKLQTIIISPNLDQSHERLFLDCIEQIKIKKCLEYAQKNPRKFSSMSNKKKRRFNRSVNQAQQNLTAQKDNQTVSAFFTRTNKILSASETKIITQQLNMKQLADNLVTCSNRIYGKNHQSESIIWCNDVLASKLQEKPERLQRLPQKQRKNRSKPKSNQSLSQTKKILEELKFKTIDKVDKVGSFF